MIDYSKVTPIKIDQKFNTLYLTYLDENGKTCYDKINNIKSYFYHADVKKSILKKEEAVKHFVDNSWETKKISQTYPITYEADINLAKRFLIDTFAGRKNIEKKPIKIASLDIENLVTGQITQDGRYPITAITVHDSILNKYFTFFISNTFSAKRKFISVKICNSLIFVNRFIKSA